MWNKLALKFQLLVFMTILVVVIEIVTLLVVQNLYKKNRIDFAQKRAQIISKSINNDLLKALLNPNVNILSDIKFRLSAFKNLKNLIIFNKQSKPILQYKEDLTLLKLKNEIIKKKIYFSEDDLYMKRDIRADGYTFGFVLLDIDLTEQKLQENHDLKTIFFIFPFALILGFILSLFFSKNFTSPFNKLLKAMRHSDPAHDKIIKLSTNKQNEIKELFDGFNQFMQQISNSTKLYIFQARHDQLTNVYNRFYIEEEVKKILKYSTKHSNALLFIDIHQFKLVNDTLGYQDGDELIKMIALHVEETLPQNALLARVDGSNFMILIKNINREEIEQFVSKYLSKLNDFRYTKNKQAISVSANIGAVSFKANEYTFKELIKALNIAIKAAKSIGKNKLHIFNIDDGISQRFDREIQVAGDIKQALKKGAAKFELFAQAIVPLQEKTDKISYEILIRMWDKEGNFVSPDDFLPTAQRYQLMVQIDMFVLWEYLELVTQNPSHIQKLHSVHINLAGATLNNADFQAKLKEAMEYFDFPWEKLELEVTETSAVGDFNKAKDFIAWLKDRGIGLALDDFGTGMSSFEYLKSLPFDIVKIDGSFVKDMHTDLMDRAVIKYIQEIAELKGQETVAEYVETLEDVNELTKLGITYGQGYFLGKPKPLSNMLYK